MLPTDVQRIQFRSDTLANWMTYNPVLAVGEPAYETDTGKVKYGNGTDAGWTCRMQLEQQGLQGLPDLLGKTVLLAVLAKKEIKAHPAAKALPVQRTP